MEELAERLARIPGVNAVTLGGSRARGEHRPDSDWDFGLYYRGSLDPEDIYALGFAGEVVDSGAWGRLVNGGAWLLVKGQRVDLLYRDLDFVEHWVREAERGYFEIDHVEGVVAGLPTYVLAGELAMAKVLSGSLPRPSFPDALRVSAPQRWLGSAAFSLVNAETAAFTANVAVCAGLLVKAVIATANARLAARGEWALNEKGIAKRVGFEEAEEILAHLGRKTDDLTAAVQRIRSLLEITRPSGLKFDRPGS